MQLRESCFPLATLTGGLVVEARLHNVFLLGKCDVQVVNPANNVLGLAVRLALIPPTHGGAGVSSAC